MSKIQIVSASEATVGRIKREPAFAVAMLDEATSLFLNGEPDVARLVLRDVVNGTMGFEQLAAVTGTPAKSLHRMLSPRGNPSMNHLSIILATVAKEIGVKFAPRTVKAA